jgi:hypothetical protein
MNDIRYGRKRSGIKRELDNKIEDWLESITDETVRVVARKNVIVTGGAIASMLLGERINDFDVYFKTMEATRVVAEYYVNVFNESSSVLKKRGGQPKVRLQEITNINDVMEERVVIWVDSGGTAEEDGYDNYFETLSEKEAMDLIEYGLREMSEEEDALPKYRPVFMSQNAITLSDKIQIIIRFYGWPEAIHDNYDFAHAMCYYVHSSEELVFPAKAMECLLSRTLIYHGSLYPIASIFRMKKFVERGWRITAGQQLKIMWQISEIDLKDPMTLREQLTGVDMAYMYELIQALKGVEAEKINSTYIGAIIDRIFE